MNEKEKTNAQLKLELKEIRLENKKLLENIEKLKQKAEYLTLSEGRYRTIFNASIDSVFILDIKNSSILYVNQQVYEILGYSYNDLINTNFVNLLKAFPNKIENNFKKRKEKAIKEGPQNFECIVKCKNDDLIQADVYLKYMIIDEKERILVFVRDIKNIKTPLGILNGKSQLKAVQKKQFYGRI